MRSQFGVLFALALTSAGASAAPFELDASHTNVHFAVAHYELSAVRGRFNAMRGTIDYEREARRGAVELVIRTDSVDTGIKVLDGILKGEDFFDVDKFAEARFVSREFVHEGDRLTSVKGELTLRDVTRPITLTANRFACKEVRILVLRKFTCGGDFNATLKRSDFGMKRYLPDVGDDVQLFISIEASPKS